jgi:hypothetical protein
VADPPVQIDVFEEVGDGCWDGRTPSCGRGRSTQALVAKGSFHDRFAAVRTTILRDEDFGHWFDRTDLLGARGPRLIVRAVGATDSRCQ